MCIYNVKPIENTLNTLFKIKVPNVFFIALNQRFSISVLDPLPYYKIFKHNTYT